MIWHNLKLRFMSKRAKAMLDVNITKQEDYSTVAAVA